MTEPDDGSLEDYLEAFLRFADGRSCVVQLGITPLALWRRAGTARRRWQRRACELYPASSRIPVTDWEARVVESNLPCAWFTERQKAVIDRLRPKYQSRRS